MSSVTALRSLTMLALVVALAACNAGQAEQRAADNESAKPAATVPSAARAHVDAPAATPTAIATQPILAHVDKARSCNTDADCAIKDVGSCCGYHPQCLNKNTPTFPEQVKERCAREGRVSACGMLAISGCQCRSGKCENLLQSDESMAAPDASAPLK